MLKAVKCAGGMKTLGNLHSQVAAHEEMASPGFEPLRDSQSRNDPMTAFGIEQLMCSHSQNLAVCEEELDEKSTFEAKLKETAMFAGEMKMLRDFHSRVAAQEKMEPFGFEPLRDSQSLNDPTTAFGIELMMNSHSLNLTYCVEKLRKKLALLLNLLASSMIQKILAMKKRKIDFLRDLLVESLTALEPLMSTALETNLKVAACAGEMKMLGNLHLRVAAPKKLTSNGFEPLRDSQSRNDSLTAFGIEQLICSHSQNLADCVKKLTKKSEQAMSLLASLKIQKKTSAETNRLEFLRVSLAYRLKALKPLIESAMAMKLLASLKIQNTSAEMKII